MNPNQANKREQKIAARQSSIEQVIKVLAAATEPLRRGFFGRMRWLFLGR